MKTLFFLCAATLCCILRGYCSNDVRQVYLTNDAGLSNSSVTCIFQDSRDVMWLGTWDGLNVYDGCDIHTLKYEAADSSSLSNNIIREIVEQRPGVMWIATDNGINRMEVGRGTGVKRFYFGYDNTPPLREHSFSIANGPDGRLFCAVYQYGLACFDELRHGFISINVPNINMFDLKAICGSPDIERLWMLDGSGKAFGVSFTVDAGVVVCETVLEITDETGFISIFPDGKDVILVGKNRTISLYDASTGERKGGFRLQLPPNNGEITSIVRRGSDLLVSLSMGGVYSCSDPGEGLNQLPSIGNIGVLSMYICRQGILWAGTDGQGVIMRYEQHRNFNTVLNDRLSSRRNTPVRCFCIDEKGRLWVGSKGNGLYVMDNHRNPAKVVRTLDTSSGLTDNAVYSCTLGPEGEIFIGTDGAGIDICSPETFRVSRLDMSLPEGNGHRFSSVYSLWMDIPQQTLWAGTSGYGLIKMKLARTPSGYRVSEYKIFRHDSKDGSSLSNNTIYSIVDGGGDSLWIGTRGGGLNLFDRRRETFTAFLHESDNSHSLSSNDILALAIGNGGRLWVGTSYGLNYVDRMENGRPHFIRITEQEGLPNNTVHGIVPENDDVVWVSTNRGLCRYRISDRSTVNYKPEDGLQNNEFADGAFGRSSDGIIYFGGIGGFNWFNPDEIRHRNFTPSLYVTDFLVFNDPHPVYNSAFFNEREGDVVLAHNESFFSIDFIAIDYYDSDNEYSYILEGFNKEWINTGTSRRAVFTNVPPGSYTFRVRSTDSDRVWGDNELSFNVRVRHSPWYGGWAVAGYLAFAGLIAYLAYLFVLHRVKLNRALFVERHNRQQQKKIHEAKLRFFTNIAHEFSTPLTLIYGPCERLLTDYGTTFDPAVVKQLHTIQSNAMRMQGLIAELMEFRKAETGHRKLSFEGIDMEELVNCVRDYFDEATGENKIELSVAVEPTGLRWTSDRDALEKIVFNLVSNAFKYTPAEGYIRIVVEGGEELSIRVTNSGKGIKHEDLDVIFDRFTILDNFERQASKGSITRTGVGLALVKSLSELLNGTVSVESVLNESTTFTVRLPEPDRSVSPPDPDEAPYPVALSLSEEGDDTPPMPDLLPAGEREDISARILVVDDVQEIRGMIAELLGDRHEILQAANGREAIGIMTRQRPDLIISDIIMPEMNGIEFMKQVKENVFTSNIPFIFLTSRATVEDKIDGYRQGADAYIPKPFHPQHLQAVVTQILVNRRSLRDFLNSSLSETDIYNGTYLSGRDKEMIVRLNEVIEKNMLNEDMDLDHISNELAVSRMQLYRKIRELTSMSPSEYIRSVKLARAAQLLRVSDFTVQEIMYRSGFNNKSYFYREFTKKYNCSPKEYRNERRTMNL